MIYKIANSIAIFSVICASIANFQKDKKKIVSLHIVCNILDSIMYLILGGKSGLANAFADGLKNISYVKFQSIKTTIIFALLRIILLIIGWEGVITLFFIIMEIVIVSLMIYGEQNGLSLKFAILIRQMIWVIYDAIFATIFIAILTSLVAVSGIIGIAKDIYDRKKAL